MITGAQCRAGRVLAEISRPFLARLCQVDEVTIEHFELKVDRPDAETIDRITKGLEQAGIIFIDENGGGVGVRLKFNASETKRLLILEGEGGVVAMDDVP